MRAASAAVVLLFLAACATQPPRTYANPVIDGDFPDPAVLRAPDGDFYVYATQGWREGRVLNIQVARSADLVTWTHLGDALPGKPAWALAKQAFWAPHVLYDVELKKYFMYYSAEPDQQRGKCLAVATSEHPAGPFADSGAPLVCGDGLEHIDPMAFDDPQTGKRLLYWGSGGMPIRARELDRDRTRFLPDAPAIELLPADDALPYHSLIEGAWVMLHDGRYYLFYSGDRCCTKEPRYAVMVARSASATGPFDQRRGAVLERSEAWLAPGHNSVIADEQGTPWMLYHAYQVGRAERGRLMLIDRIEWQDGWPTVRDGRPSAGQTVAPATGIGLNR
jgi:arabinan endo-1,5-alpha-L-arabinosidase